MEGPTRVLIIDDSSADRELVRLLLEEEEGTDWFFIEAARGREGLGRARALRPHLVLVDYRLPDLDGLAVVRRLRALDRGDGRGAPPVLMLTGAGREEIAAAAIKAGAQDYLVKGDLTPERLRTAVHIALESGRLRCELACRVRQLEARNRELESYASVIAHDLKAPLQGIMLNAEIVLMQCEGLPPDAHRHLGRLIRSAERMGELMNDLLRYAQAGEEEEPPEVVSLDGVVAAVLQDLQPLVEEARGAVEVGELPEVLGHPAQVRQLFQNLVGNALKFRGAAAPRVRISAAPCPPGWCIRVQDNGPGIEAQDQDRIFRVFHRTEAARSVEGTGIGLAICQKIAESLGGSLRVESAPGEGAAFLVTLPLLAADPAAAEQVA